MNQEIQQIMHILPATGETQKTLFNQQIQLLAESKKLHTVINMSSTTASELMAINRSVKVAVDTAIQLKIALKAKLELFFKIIF